MITVSYERTGNGIYISHTDVLRCLNKTFRRAGIDVKYSNGFNKHMALKMSQPLPLGIASMEEWVTADVDGIGADEFMIKFNENCPPFLKCTAAYATNENPSIAAKVAASEYKIKCAEAEKLNEKIADIKNNYIVKYDKNGEHFEKDVSELIFDMKTEEGFISCVLAFGNVNLRTDILTRQFNEDFGFGIGLTDIMRTRQFLYENNLLIPAKKYMEELK